MKLHKLAICAALSSSAIGQVTTHHNINFEEVSMSPSSGARDVFNSDSDDPTAGIQPWTTGGLALTSTEIANLGLTNFVPIPTTRYNNSGGGFWISGPTQSSWGKGTNALATQLVGTFDLTSFVLQAGHVMTATYDAWGVFAGTGAMSTGLLVNNSLISSVFVEEFNATDSPTQVTATYQNNTGASQNITLTFTKIATPWQGHSHNVVIDNILVTSIPEPSCALLGGLGTLVLFRRRRA